MPRNIPRELKSAINMELRPFERILYSTKPIPSRLSSAFFSVWFFAIPWTAFSLFWMFMAAEPWRTQTDGANQAINIAFPLFGLPFVLVGLSMLLSPLWAYLKAKRMYYIITDRRVLVVTGGRTIKIQSLDPKQMENSTTHIRADGSGNIIFDRKILSHIEQRQAQRVNRLYRRGLYGVPNVTDTKRYLEKMLQEVRQEEV